MSSPVIGINMDVKSSGPSRSFAYVNMDYVDSIIAVGAIPLLLPPVETADEVKRYLRLIDGFVLIGGADLDPRRDGFMQHRHTKIMEPRRETFDRILARFIVDKKLPVLAIGAGMQLLNTVAGGTHSLHIAEDFPSAMPHFDGIDGLLHRHQLLVEPGSFLAGVYGDAEVRVNSMHHMAIDDVAPGFFVSARSPDGIIEGIESEDWSEWVALGLQYHPEASTAVALELRIFEEFVALL